MERKKLKKAPIINCEECGKPVKQYWNQEGDPGLITCGKRCICMNCFDKIMEKQS